MEKFKKKKLNKYGYFDISAPLKECATVVVSFTALIYHKLRGEDMKCFYIIQAFFEKNISQKFSYCTHNSELVVSL